MRLVLAGAGHGHVALLHDLGVFVSQGIDVTVVSPSPYHYYSGMGPGLLGGDYEPQEVRFEVKRLTEQAGATFFHDRVVHIAAHDNALRLASGRTVEYDLLSCNVGSQINTDGIQIAPDVSADSFLPAKPIENLYTLRGRVVELCATGGSIVVVGGGPAAVEIAGNIAELVRGHGSGPGSATQICLCAGGELLRHFPLKLKRIALSSLSERGVRIRHGYIRRIERNALLCEDGTRQQADIVVLATGVTPPAWLRESALAVGDDGGILVDHFLKSTSHANVFAAGDCASLTPFPIRRIGLHAVQQAIVLRKNVAHVVRGLVAGASATVEKDLTAFVPQSQFLLILNVGGGIGIASKWGATFSGRLAYRLKDRIDKSFMKRFA